MKPAAVRARGRGPGLACTGRMNRPGLVVVALGALAAVAAGCGFNNAGGNDGGRGGAGAAGMGGSSGRGGASGGGAGVGGALRAPAASRAPAAARARAVLRVMAEPPAAGGAGTGGTAGAGGGSGGIAGGGGAAGSAGRGGASGGGGAAGAGGAPGGISYCGSVIPGGGRSRHHHQARHRAKPLLSIHVRRHRADHHRRADSSPGLGQRTGLRLCRRRVHRHRRRRDQRDGYGRVFESGRGRLRAPCRRRPRAHVPGWRVDPRERTTARRRSVPERPLPVATVDGAASMRSFSV